MPRSITLHRRRANLIDVTIPFRSNVTSYQFFAATNFDGVYTQFETVPVGGMVSASVVRTGSETSSFRGLTRFQFSPADYSLDDTKPIWISIKQVTNAGVVGTAEAGTLILPYASDPNRIIVLNGIAPNTGTIAGSINIILPQQCQNLLVQTIGGSSTGMWVAFEPGGQELYIPLSTTSATYTELVYPSITQLLVRGDGSAAPFNAVLSMRNNPLV